MANHYEITHKSHVVSVIIPSIGRSTLTETQASLKNQTRQPDEIIIEFDRDRQGPGVTKNNAFSKSVGDLIVFTDDDCISGNDWLEKMIQAVDEHDADMVSSHFTETDFFLQEIRTRRKFPTTTQVNPEGFIGTGGNVIFKRECLQACFKNDGFIFNPIFGIFGSEDIDLVFRLHKMGYKLVFIPNTIKHLKKMTPLTYLKHQFNRGIGIGILYRVQKNHAGTTTPDQSLLWSKSNQRFPILKWINMIWKKGFGPFDLQSFSTKRHFLVFWIGEKAQAFGFLYSFFIPT